VLGDDKKNILDSSYSEIEDGIKLYFETDAKVPWIVPIDESARFTTTKLLEKIGRKNGEEFGLEVRKIYSAIEIDGKNNKIGETINKDEDIEKIRNFMIAFLFGKADVPCYLTCDSGPNIVKKIVAESETVQGLIMPQNISDSAVATGRNLTSASDTYYFPVGTDPLIDSGDAATPLGVKPLVGINDAMPAEFQSVANNLTGPYGVQMYFSNDGFSDKNDYGFKQNIQFPDSGGGGKVEIIYGAGIGGSGPSVDQLLELQVKTKSLAADETKFPNVVPGPGAVQLSDFLNKLTGAQKTDALNFVKTGINQNKHSLYMDIKRAGDQDQCLAVHLARKKLTNVALVTGDPTCAIRNRSYDNATIEQFGQRIRLYRSMFSAAAISEVDLAKIEFDKVRREANMYFDVVKFYCQTGAASSADALIDLAKGQITSVPEPIDFYLKVKFDDLIAFFESLKIDAATKTSISASCALVTEKVADLPDGLDKGTVESRTTDATGVLTRLKGIWTSIQAKLNSADKKNLIPKTLEFMTSIINLLKGIPEPFNVTKSESLLNYYRKSGTKRNRNDIEELTRSLKFVFNLIEKPSAGGRPNIIGEIEYYNKNLKNFTNGFFNFETGKNFYYANRILIENDTSDAAIDAKRAAPVSSAIFESETEDEEQTTLMVYTGDVKTKIDAFKYALLELAKEGNTRSTAHKDALIAAITALQENIVFPAGTRDRLPPEVATTAAAAAGAATAATFPIQKGGGEKDDEKKELLILLFNKLDDLFGLVSDKINGIITKHYADLVKAERLQSLYKLVENTFGLNYLYVNERINSVNNLLGAGIGTIPKFNSIAEITAAYKRTIRENIQGKLIPFKKKYDITAIKASVKANAKNRFETYISILKEITLDLMEPSSASTNKVSYDEGLTASGGAATGRSIDYNDIFTHITFLNDLLKKGMDNAVTGADFEVNGLTTNSTGVELALAFFNDMIHKTKDSVSYFDFFMYTRSGFPSYNKPDLMRNPEKLILILVSLSFQLSDDKELQASTIALISGGARKNFMKTFKKRKGGKRKQTYRYRK
jgi:hypothetical protein